jgi:hypothetical protein
MPLGRGTLSVQLMESKVSVPHGRANIATWARRQRTQQGPGLPEPVTGGTITWEVAIARMC